MSLLPEPHGAAPLPESSLLALTRRMKKTVGLTAAGLAVSSAGVLYLAFIAGGTGELGARESVLVLLMSLLLPTAFVFLYRSCRATQEAMLTAMKDQHAFEERFAELYQKTPVMMHSIDPQGRLLAVNEYWLRTLGYERKEVLGRSHTDFLTEESRRHAQETGLPTFFKLGYCQDVAYQMVTKDGRVLDVLLSATSARDELGRIVASRATTVDITALRRAEAEREAVIRELEKKNLELERFAHTVSHDLKSPLVTIKGFVSVLEKDGDLSEQLKTYVGYIAGAADRMKELVDGLLKLLRTGQDLHTREDVEMGELAQETKSLLSGALRARGVDVVIEPDLPRIRCDRMQMLQVFQNLIENAIKFMGDQEEPRIEVGMRRDAEGEGRSDGGEVTLFVRDNGLGLDPVHGDKVFGLFQKLDKAGPGSGLGLALVQRIVEAHEGRAWVKSEGIGTGCTVFFTLPTEHAAS